MFAYNFTHGGEPARWVPASTLHVPWMFDDAQPVSESPEQIPLYFKEDLRALWATETLLDNNAVLSCDYSNLAWDVDSIEEPLRITPLVYDALLGLLEIYTHLKEYHTTPDTQPWTFPLAAAWGHGGTPRCQE